MNLHHDTQLFSQTLRAASQHLMINLGFVEKDYWITLLLRRLSGSKYSDEAVFKGGTSLSKGYRLIDRFSEDVDLAIVNMTHKTGNEIKTIIRHHRFIKLPKKDYILLHIKQYFSSDLYAIRYNFISLHQNHCKSI